MEEDTRYDKLEKSVKNYKIFSYILAFFVIINLLGNFTENITKIDDFRIRYFTPKQIPEDQSLYNQTVSLSKYLIDFSAQRNLNEPRNFWSNKSWEEKMNEDDKYSAETKFLYKTKFLHNITLLRNEFLKRGIKNDDFEMMYDFPVGPYPYEQIAIDLGEMANILNVTKNN